MLCCPVPAVEPPGRGAGSMTFNQDATHGPSQDRIQDRVDVLIGGAGFAGLALAIALRQALGPTFSVVVTDPALGRPVADARASAIAAAARRLFETIGVWDGVAARAEPILDMVITD